MNLLRQWILNIVSCALLLGLANQFMPEGSVRKVVRFTGALLLCIVLLQPVKDLSLALPEADLSAYQQTVSVLELELTAQRESAFKKSIEAQTQSYIKDKALELGLTVRAEVTAQMQDGAPLPHSAVLYGKREEALACYMEQALGITGENQTWIETDGSRD